MSWVAFLANPQAVVTLFTATDGFTDIELHEVIAGREGPGLRLRFDIAAVPSPLPRRWDEGANTTQFVIAAWDVADLRLVGWGWSVSGGLNVSRVGERLQLQFAGSGCELTASCAMLRVEGVSGYINEGLTKPVSLSGGK
jgi:hypothetical protein